MMHIVSFLFLNGSAGAATCSTNPGSCGSTCLSHPSGVDGEVYRINTNDFDAAQQTAIFAAGQAWQAGGSHPIRGALWSFLPSPFGHLTSDGVDGDGVNNIRKKPDSWFSARYLFGEATTQHIFGVNNQCECWEHDITFRGSVTWSVASPSDVVSPALSLSAVLVHEFGHSANLFHENDVIATMNSSDLSDISENVYRVGEDDAKGLQLLHPDSATGKNFMLQRWGFDSGDVTQVWTDSSEWYNTWSGSAGGSLSIADGPSGIWAHVVGTASSVSVGIQWWLSSSQDCSGARWTVGTRTPTMTSNVAYYIDGPTGGWSFLPTMSSGNYWLCAEIDYGDLRSETSEDDNVIVGDKLFTIN